jgi:2,3-bisphosphoglycerate-independent phosphoglycerate mutase
MSAGAVADEAARAMSANRFEAIVMNFANADMVGHTGKIPETISAIETLDACFARLEDSARENGWLLVLTADHGNAEQMIDPSTGEPHTAHTSNPVPFLISSGSAPLRSGGALRDVAPTLLGLQGLPVPEEMTGRDLTRA